MSDQEYWKILYSHRFFIWAIIGCFVSGMIGILIETNWLLHLSAAIAYSTALTMQVLKNDLSAMGLENEKVSYLHMMTNKVLLMALAIFIVLLIISVMGPTPSAETVLPSQAFL